MASDVRETPFVKQLAGSDPTARDEALSSLRTYLGGRRTFDELELLKLWKGLFFCVWMSDKPLTQQRLVLDLQGLLDVLPDDNALPFLAAFWKTMAREWNGIDALRMDKYLLLIRGYLGASFAYLARQDWEVAMVKQYMDILSSVPLSCTDSKIPDGMRYHVLDVYVDELDKADTPRKGSLPLEMLLVPVTLLKEYGFRKAVRRRAKETLNDERLSSWNDTSKEKVDEEIDKDWEGFGSDHE